MEIPPGKKPVIIVFMHSNLRKAHWGKIIELFSKRYPWISVATDYVPETKRRDKLVALHAGGVAPDVGRYDDDEIPMWAEKRLLHPLDEHMERSQIDFSQFDDVALNASRYGGKLWSAATGFLKELWYYNIEMFDAKGLQYPPADPFGWSWEDFLETAKKLTGENVWGVAPVLGFDCLPWITSNGGSLISEDGRSFTGHLPAAVEGFQFGYDLTIKHKVTPQAYTVEDGQTMFAESRLGLYDDSHRYINWLAQKAPEIKYDVGNWPARKETPLTETDIIHFAIAEKSERREEAWLFIEWLWSPPIQRIFAESLEQIPINREALQAFLSHESPKNLELFRTVVEKQPTPFPRIPYELDKPIRAEFEAMLLDRKTAQQAMDEKREEFQAIIDRRIRD
jgi:multiple sugar transport system substrate-binding protein